MTTIENQLFTSFEEVDTTYGDTGYIYSNATLKVDLGEYKAGTIVNAVTIYLDNKCEVYSGDGSYDFYLNVTPVPCTHDNLPNHS